MPRKFSYSEFNKMNPINYPHPLLHLFLCTCLLTLLRPWGIFRLFNINIQFIWIHTHLRECPFTHTVNLLRVFISNQYKNNNNGNQSWKGIFFLMFGCSGNYMHFFFLIMKMLKCIWLCKMFMKRFNSCL